MIAFDSLKTGQALTALESVEGQQVPQGTPLIIDVGRTVSITQALGQSLTVDVNGRLARINSDDFLKFGVILSSKVDSKGPIKDQIWDILRQTYDPEIPVNVVELGLIYDLRISTLIDSRTHISIDMTLTAPGCGMGPILADDLKTKIESIDGVDQATIQIVFDPPWDASRMTEEARLEAGLF